MLYGVISYLGLDMVCWHTSTTVNGHYNNAGHAFYPLRYMQIWECVGGLNVTTVTQLISTSFTYVFWRWNTCLKYNK